MHNYSTTVEKAGFIELGSIKGDIGDQDYGSVLMGLIKYLVVSMV